MESLLDAWRDIVPGDLDDRALKDLLCQLARIRAGLDALEAGALTEMERRGCYVTDGAVNAKAWLAHHTGVARGIAGARVRLAKRLARLPEMTGALADGEVTEGHARSLARCVTPRTLVALARDEVILTNQARTLEADLFDHVITRWLALNDQDGPEPPGPDSTLHASRTFANRVRIDGDLDADDGAEFLAELDALYDQLWQQDHADQNDPAGRRTPSERNAAALVEMARRSSATHADDDTDAGTAPRGGRPRRRQLIAVVTIDPSSGELPATATLDDGSILPRSTIERWLCDCAISRVILHGPSQVLDLGQTTYTPSAAQRRALVARDRGCIVDGCDRRPRWCDAHHVTPYPQGSTDLRNLVLLCSRHHKQVHAAVIKLIWVDHQWLAHRPDGTRLHRRRPPAAA